MDVRFQNLIGMLGRYCYITEINGYKVVSKPYRYARKERLMLARLLEKELFQNLIGMLGRVSWFLFPSKSSCFKTL